jgi:hypothetical protein
MRPRLLPRRRCEYSGPAGPVLRPIADDEHAARVRGCLAKARETGQSDLAAYYQHQLIRFDGSTS